MDHIEPWPKTFRASADAVHWADSFLVASREDRMQMVPKKAKGRRVSMEDLDNMARTISLEVAKIGQPAAGVYRYVHGRTRQILDSADYLAHMAWTGQGDLPASESKTIATCRDIAVLLLEDRRQREHAGRGLSIEAIALQLGISRRTLYNHWIGEVSAIREQLDRLLLKGDAHLDDQLGALGVLGD